jgi:hypothetical protein
MKNISYEEFLEFANLLLEGQTKSGVIESFDILYKEYPHHTDMLLTEISVSDGNLFEKRPKKLH